MIHKSMRERLLSENTFEGAIATILRDVVALHGAEFGDVQLPLDGALVIVDHIGLSADFLKAFERVGMEDGCACGRALRERRTIVIPDVALDAEYAPYQSQARATRYRSVQTTPLFTAKGNLMGMVSTLFANTHVATNIEMQTLHEYSITAAEHLKSVLGTSSLAEQARDMHARLRSRFEIA